MSQLTPIFFTTLMYSFSQERIDQGFALVYIYDTRFLAHIKPHMLELFENLHKTSSAFS